MALGNLWAGKAFGTSTGNLFLDLQGDDSALTGTLRLNEDNVGITVLAVAGSFDGAHLRITAQTQDQVAGKTATTLTATASLNPKGELAGEWSTGHGAAGTFILFPHIGSQSQVESNNPAEQLHTARHNFGAIVIDREKILELSENIQSHFKSGKVIVTISKNTDQSLFLEDFKSRDFLIQKRLL